jgi:putative mRNA 3-end processing factor
VFATFPTIPITQLLLEDNEKVALRNGRALPFRKQDTKKLGAKFFGLPYGLPYEFYDGTRFRFLDAGHIIGAGQVLVEKTTGGKARRLLYTGDFNAGETRMHAPAKPPEEAGEGIDALIIESTYANREHPPREEIERRFVNEVQKAIDDDCVALVPCFAVGRTQEVLQVLHANRLRGDLFVQGMGVAVSEISTDFPSYVKNAGMLNAALARAKRIETNEQRQRVVEKPCVIVATAGMLDGGPALSYLQALNRRGNGVVFLTGFQVQGTNGSLLTAGEKIWVNERARREKVTLPFSQWDFSAHSGHSQLVDYVKKINADRVFCMHGDAAVCVEFARELREQHGFNAVAPLEEEKFSV